MASGSLSLLLLVPPVLLLLPLPCLSLRPMEGLLRNGDFERGPKLEVLNKSRFLARDTLPEWEISGVVEYITAGPQPGGMFFMPPHGHHAVRLGNNGSVTQTVPVKSGSLYALTVGSSRTCAQDEVLRVSIGRMTSGDLPLQTLYSSRGDDVYALGFRASAGSAVVTLFNPGIQEDRSCGPLVDIVAIKQLSVPLPTRGNLVRNGGFEEGPLHVDGYANAVLLPPKASDAFSPLPGWIIESLKAVKYIHASHFNMPGGRAAVELVAGMESAIAQVIRTTGGKEYVLQFKVGDARNDCRGQMMVQAFAGGGTVKVGFSSRGKGSFVPGSLKFTAQSSRTRITFFSSSYQSRARDAATLCGPVLDDVSVFPSSL